MDTVTIYLGEDGYWRWRRKAPNGEIISSGEGYTRKGDAIMGARRANLDQTGYIIDVEGPHER